MRYREAIDRIRRNCNDKMPDTELLVEYKNDMQDVLVDAFGRSHAPRKTERHVVTKKEDIKEDFSDDSLIDGMTLDTFTVDSGKAVLSGTGAEGKIKIEELTELMGLEFNIEATSETDGGSSQVEVKVYASDDSVLFSNSFDLDEGSSDTKVYSMTLTKGIMYVEISVVNSSQVDAETSIDNLIIKKDQDEVKLSANVFFPLEVTFKTGDGKQYISKEILGEEFLRWSPTKYNFDESEGDITDPVSDVAAYFMTEENVLYDRKIGYYFENNDEGDLLLKYKPSFDGYIDIYFAFIPDITISDGEQMPLNKFFDNMIVSGVSTKRLYRKLMKAENELQYNGILMNIRQFKSTYDDLLNRLAGWMSNEKTTTHFVRPFNIQDFSKDLDGYS